VDRRSLDRKAADILREQILSGLLAPGCRLVETTLANQLAVSRSTLRTALRALSHEDLVDQVAYTRWTVPEISDRDAWELYTLRGSLEGLAARLAAQRRSLHSIATLQTAFDRLASAIASRRHRDVAEADLALHKTIVAITEHKRLIAQYRLLEQQMRRYIVLSSALIVDLRRMLAEHRPIVEAIAAGDCDRAEKLARDHNTPEVEKIAARLEGQSTATAVQSPPRRTNPRQRL
jgi:DNA-binding GntR family transcriptional regulator